jgi:hypothetical protein
MYATLGVSTNSKHSGELIGTHQKLDKAARRLLGKYLPATSRKFPSIDEILYFEGSRGPDGLKRKSPGVDEPEHFIIPGKDDGVLIGYIRNHHYNLVQALKKKDRERAAFEAAWMAHAITDGLTPAHHYPFREERDELVGDADYVKVFGVELKGVSKGDSFAETMRKNWLYLGAGGLMTKHIAFEYGVAYTITPVPLKRLWPKNLHHDEFDCADSLRAFYAALDKVVALKMYDRFLKKGWTTQLVSETRRILIPEIIRAVALSWASAVNGAQRAKLIAKGKSNA